MIRKIKVSIFIALSYVLIFGQSIVLAQTTASILPQGVTQFLDNNANPLSAGKVYFYIPNTTTFKTTWQDSAKTIANTNPVILDAAGRAKIYGDGTYRQRVTNSANNQIWDAVTASAGSGGGTTGTGDGDLVGTIKPWAGLIAPNQYVFAYGQEVSRTTYSVLFTAITLQQSITCSAGSPTATGFSDTSQIPVVATIESICFAPGTSVISKTSTTVTFNNNSSINTTDANARIFPYRNGNGSTTFNLPDLRGLVIAGRNNMGGIPSSRLSFAGLNDNPNATYAGGGNQTTTLITSNLPAYTPAGTVAYTPAGTLSGTINAAITDPGHTHTYDKTNTNVIFAAGGANGAIASFTPTATTSQTTGVTASVNLASGTFIGTAGAPVFTGTAQGGTSLAFPNVQPTVTLNYIIKITPDSNSADASGVTSIQGMVGDIACGAGLLCTGNIINTTSASIGEICITDEPYNASPSASPSFNSSAINAALAAHGSVCVPPGIFDVDATINLFTGYHLNGKGQGKSVLRQTTANIPLIKVGAFQRNFGFNNLTLDRSVLATLGGDGLTDDESNDSGDFHHIEIKNQYNGIKVGNTGWSQISFFQIFNNVNHGIYLTSNVVGAAGLQWQLDNGISGPNGGSGYAVECSGTMTRASMGNWSNISSFNNTGNAIRAVGSVGCPIHAMRVNNAFFGEDLGSEIYLDTFGITTIPHTFNNIVMEASGLHGYEITANNAVSISNTLITNMQRHGILSAASKLTINGGNINNNGLSGTPSSGILITAGSTQITDVYIM